MKCKLVKSKFGKKYYRVIDNKAHYNKYKTIYNKASKKYYLKNIEEWKIYHKEYDEKYKEEKKKRNRKRYLIKKEYLSNLIKQNNKKHPWLKHFYGARYRCNKENSSGYKYYGGRGIEFNMSKENFEYLWKRDNAYLLFQPSIDRINVNGDYTINNCRFIERGENSRRRFI